MKTASAVFAGVCLVAIAALAEPPAPITKDGCRPGPRCATGEVLSKGQCCERATPEPVKKAEKEPQSPIEGFALSDIQAIPVGEFRTSCAIDRRKKELTMKTAVQPAKAGAYGGCCYENPEALPLEPSATATASLHISRGEEIVRVKVEQSSGVRQGYLHNGRLEAGLHQLSAGNLGLPEVRRLCVEVAGGYEGAAHDTSVTVKRVTFANEVSVKPRG